MATSVTFPVNLGGDGSTITDDSDVSTGLANGGHRTRFVPALAQTVAMANTAKLAAEGATNASGSNSTSTTSLALSTGSKTLTIQTGKSIVVGMQVIIAYTTTPTSLMRGTVTSYNSGTGQLIVSVDYASTTGTFALWTVSLTGVTVIPPASEPLVSNIVVSGTAQTAVKNNHYILTNVAATTVTLPAGPTAGDRVRITVGNAIETNIIARNGQTIMGSATDLTLDDKYASINLQFINSSWRIMA